MERKKENKRAVTANYFSICNEVLMQAERIVVLVSLRNNSKAVLCKTCGKAKNEITYEMLCILI